MIRLRQGYGGRVARAFLLAVLAVVLICGGEGWVIRTVARGWVAWTARH